MYTLFKENYVNASIPDQGGISNTINVYREGVISNIKVHVNITHPFGGDLIVKLSNPAGKQVTLHNREGYSSDDVQRTYEGEIVADLIGSSARGLWTLTVEDHAARDSGTLNTWGIDLECDAFRNHRTELFISEVQKDDVLTSVQQCRLSGRVIAAEADVEIDHPLIGDLIVSLVSPSGKEVILQNREGGSQTQLKRHWNTDALNAFKGESTQGTWTLKVRNFHSSNDGKVKYWKIKFRYERRDDLKVVEGIGPKIEELLNNAGIYSYVSLAASSTERIKDILINAGSRFQMHDPSTWGQQSLLASQGKWDELQILKDKLDGGRVD